MTRRFRPGEISVYQDVWRGAVLQAIPSTVIDDDGDVLVSHLVPGTRVRAQPPRPGMSSDGAEDDTGERQRDRIFAMLNEPSTELVERKWTRNRRLMIAKTGARHIVSLFWRSADDRFLGWYVDFVEPVRRTPIGIATMDLMLDIEVEPDLSAWSWKDDADFDAAVESGLYSRELERDVRAEAERAIEAIERKAWPFDTDWPQWRPDARQRRATLPPDWATVFPLRG
ncbi:MAG TPA: DUF402 domain-containing protein [Candidatus Dormibacteraeota bacterium]|nr:DUF402 domain-containing protein [Candidatus Dormibacteraeota bacterium]